MTERALSSTAALRTMQVLVARELVESRGISVVRAANLLGLAPSAVSQYLSGKRLRRELQDHATDDRARRRAREVADRVTSGELDAEGRSLALLNGAAEWLGSPSGREPGGSSPGPVAPEGLRALERWARDRVRTEQAAVANCMRLAQKARDELTRAVFRQIASDSLRHAEIVASLSTYLDRGTTTAYASGVTRREVAELIEREREAESEAVVEGGPGLGGLLALLLESMEADERKHGRMLESLLASGFHDR